MTSPNPKPLPKRLLAILERFNVDNMPCSPGKTTIHAEGGEVAILSYDTCSGEQKAFLDSFTFSSFRSTYALTNLHRENEDKPSLIDIPARSGIAKIILTPSPFSHVIVRIGAGNTLLISEEHFLPRQGEVARRSSEQSEKRRRDGGVFSTQPSISSIEFHVGTGSKVDVVSLLDGSSAPRILVRSATLASDARLDWHPHLLGKQWEEDRMVAPLRPGSLNEENRNLIDSDKKSSLKFHATRGVGGIQRRLMLDIHTLLDGTGAESNLFGTYLGRDEEEYYLTYESTHRATNAKSNMVVHGCLMDKSLGIFNGQVTIEPTGHGSTTFVGERCLLLGDKARHGSTPALSVNTNDVQAGHSSATSQIDEEQLFYAASRGLPAEDAKDLIIHGFLQTMLDHIPSAVRIDLPENLIGNESRG